MKSLWQMNEQRKRVIRYENSLNWKNKYSKLFKEKITAILKSYGVNAKGGTYIPDIACLICAAKYGGKSEDYTIATSIYSYRLNEVAIMEINKKIY